MGEFSEKVPSSVFTPRDLDLLIGAGKSRKSLGADLLTTVTRLLDPDVQLTASYTEESIVSLMHAYSWNSGLKSSTDIGHATRKGLNKHASSPGLWPGSWYCTAEPTASEFMIYQYGTGGEGSSYTGLLRSSYQS